MTTHRSKQKHTCIFVQRFGYVWVHIVPRNVKIHLETYIQENAYMLQSGCIYAHVIHMLPKGYKKGKEDKFEKNMHTDKKCM